MISILDRAEYRRGVGNLIVLLLMIILSLVALSLLWGAIQKIIRPNFSPEFSCIDAKISSPIVIESSCYNLTTGDLEVRIKRNLDDFSISRMNFEFTGNEHSSTWKCGEGCSCNVPEKGESKTYFFNIEGENVPSAVQIWANECFVAAKEVTLCD